MSLVILFRTGIVEADGSSSGRAFTTTPDAERHGVDLFADQMYGGYKEEDGTTFLSGGGKLLASEVLAYQYGGTTTTHARLYDVYWNGTHWIPNTLLAESDPLVTTGSGSIYFHHIFSGYDLVAGTRYAIVFRYAGPSSYIAELLWTGGYAGGNGVQRLTPAGAWNGSTNVLDFAVYKAGEIAFVSGAIAGSDGSASGIGAATGASSVIVGAVGSATGVGAASAIAVTPPTEAVGSAAGSGVISGVTAFLITGAGSAAGTANPILIDEGFEGTGPPGDAWQDSGGAGVEWDYNVAPLAGSQSLKIFQDAVYYGEDPELSALNHSELWLKFRVRFDALPSNVTEILTIENVVYLYLHADGTLSVYGDSSEAFTVASVVVGQVYDFFVHLRVGQSDNTLFEFYFTEAGGERLNTGDRYAYFDNDSFNIPVVEFSLNVTNGAIVVYDNFQIATADTFAPIASAIWDSAGAPTGVGAATAVGEAVSSGSIASSVGTSTVSANSARFVGAAGASAGVGAAQSNSVALRIATSVSTGSGVSAATSSSVWNTVGNTTGVGTAAANTAARWSAIYSSTGLSLVIGLGTDGAASGVDASTAGLGSANAISARYVSAAAAGGGVSTVQSQSSTLSLAAWVSLGAGGAQAESQSVTISSGSWSSIGIGTALADSSIKFSSVGSSGGYGEGYGFTQSTYCGTGEAEGSCLVDGKQFVIPTFEYFLDLEHGAKQSQSGLIGFVASSGIATLRAQSAVGYPRSD